MGSLFRTAAAFGAREIILCGITGGPPRPDLAKVSLGAENMVPWRFHKDPFAAIEPLRKAGHSILLLDTGPGSVPLPKHPPARPVLVLGGERGGLPDGLSQVYGPPLRIPHEGPKDCLNVSVAAGIGAFWASGGGSL